MEGPSCRWLAQLSSGRRATEDKKSLRFGPGLFNLCSRLERLSFKLKAEAYRGLEKRQGTTLKTNNQQPTFSSIHIKKRTKERNKPFQVIFDGLPLRSPYVYTGQYLVQRPVLYPLSILLEGRHIFSFPPSCRGHLWAPLRIALNLLSSTTTSTRKFNQRRPEEDNDVRVLHLME